MAGSLVLWVGVPPGVSVAALFEEASRAGVTFVAGAAFYPEPNDQPFLRLNFAAVDEEQIEQGIAVLGHLLHQHLAPLAAPIMHGVDGDNHRPPP